PEPGGSKANLAMSWMAHRPSNELLSLYLINRANNLQQFELGIQHFECPAQNFVYSDRQGNIAIWGQGRFINKWKNQGKFVMRGDISATLWGDTIPMNENPKAVNPPSQYLASANQNVSDNSYPYWYNGDFTEFRSWAIHYLIDQDTLPQTVKKMKALQNNNYSVLAATVCPLLDSFPLFTDTVSWRNPFQGWDYCYSAYSHHAVLFQYFWRAVRRASWEQKLGYLPGRLIPADEVTLQLLAAEDSEDFRTLTGQNRDSVLWKSIHIAIDSVQNLSKQRGVDTLPWYLYNNTTITHLARIPAFSYGPILTGGWKNAVNAVSETHGPSWRMIVQMKPAGVQAWISYPGGQS